jgi:hypothetical protein
MWLVEVALALSFPFFEWKLGVKEASSPGPKIKISLLEQYPVPNNWLNGNALCI